MFLRLELGRGECERRSAHRLCLADDELLSGLCIFPLQLGGNSVLLVSIQGLQKTSGDWPKESRVKICYAKPPISCFSGMCGAVVWGENAPSGEGGAGNIAVISRLTNKRPSVSRFLKSEPRDEVIEFPSPKRD